MKLQGYKTAAVRTVVFFILLASATSDILPCGAQIQGERTVETTADAFSLSEDVNCSGGIFTVTWAGHVVVQQTIDIGSGTELIISGSDSDAVVNGNYTTALFGVHSASLKLTNMQLVNGYKKGSGGAIYATEASVIELSGNNKFARSYAEVNGGAVMIDSSTLSWEGNTTFVNNMAGGEGGGVGIDDYSNLYGEGFTTFFNNSAVAGGGAILACDGSNVDIRGQLEFTHNSAHAGGALKVTESTILWSGNTTFSNNTADGDGGGALWAVQSFIAASGITKFTHNFAAQGGGALRFGRASTAVFEGPAYFLENQAGFLGGALFESDSTNVTFLDTMTASGNSAKEGGGFSLAGDSKETSFLRWNHETIIENNHAFVDGGGIWIEELCSVSWGGSMSITGNTAERNGGGIAITGDGTLSAEGPTVFGHNSAIKSGGAVYSISNLIGQQYNETVFEYNSAAVGGAIATYSTGPETANNYINCSFQHNTANATGGAVEASVGSDRFQHTLFLNNTAGGVGGALRLSGSTTLAHVSFDNNTAGGEGPAVSNLGNVEQMVDVSFEGNTFTCEDGEYGEFVEVKYSSDRYETVCDGCLSWETCESCAIKGNDSRPACTIAMEFVVAENDAKLETLAVDKGYWRATKTSKEILACYNEDACLGGQTGSQGYCKEGYKGPYCSICQEGYAAGLGFTCDSCSGSRRLLVMGLAIAMIAVATACVAYIATYLVSTNGGGSQSKWLHQRLLRTLPLSSVKIIIVMWQILTQYAAIANVTYPKSYEAFLKLVDVVNLDFGWMVSAACFWSRIDFHDRLLLSTLGPLGGLAGLAVTYTIAQRRISAISSLDDGERARVCRVRHVSALLLLTFLVYSSVSSIIFRTFSCENLDDGYEYLRDDYRIICTEDRHSMFKVYAGIMIVVYPVGIPLLYATLLMRRGGVTIDGVSNDSRGALVDDLQEPYRPERFYYEVIECARRVSLTGVSVFIFPGDAAQIALTLVITFVFFVVSEVLRPYKRSFDTWLSRMGHIVVLCSFYFALMFKVDVSNEREESQEAFGVVLVIVHLCLIVAVLGQAAADCFSSMRTDEDELPRSNKSNQRTAAPVDMEIVA